jgi:hypothetical protein
MCVKFVISVKLVVFFIAVISVIFIMCVVSVHAGVCLLLRPCGPGQGASGEGWLAEGETLIPCQGALTLYQDMLPTAAIQNMVVRWFNPAERGILDPGMKCPDLILELTLPHLQK